MGAQQSAYDDANKIKKTKLFINDIAVNYFANGTYTDMINLTNPEKCQQTIILTKDILKKNMTEIELSSLHNEIYKDTLVEMYISPILKLQADNNLKCKQIAEHYILIGNIYNMIKKAFLLNSENEATNGKVVNLCSNRLKRIKIDSSEIESHTVNISKNVCNDKNSPDINILEQLYGHNYKNVELTDTEELLHKNLNSSIDKSKELIAKYETVFDDKPYEIEKSSYLVSDYNKIVENIEKQIEVAQLKLIAILQKIFYYDIDKNIKISSKINGVNIETLAKETTTIVSEMYLTCENEFHRSVQFQEAINNFKKNNTH